MKLITNLLLLVCFAICSSCGAHKQEREDDVFMSHLAQLERDFCSTNIVVAEKGLLAHRQWLLHRLSAGETYNHNLFQTDARLFQLYEFKGATNEGETFYREGVQAYDKYLRSQHRLDAPISSKEELRARLARQQKGQDVGWKRTGEASK